MDILIYIVIACVLLVSFVHVKALYRRKKFFGNRKHLSLEELHKEYQADLSKEHFEEIWQKIAKSLHINPGLLRSSDKIIDLSKLIGFGEMCLEDIEAMLEDKNVTTNNIQHDCTVKDLIQQIIFSQSKT